MNGRQFDSRNEDELRGRVLSDRGANPKFDTRPVGWRARIGLIVPSVETGIINHEYNGIFPQGVSLLETRVMLRNSSPEALLKLSDEVVRAAELLASAKPDVISYSCTAGAFMRGAEYEEDLIRKIGEISGAKTTTMATAVVRALEFLGVAKILVAAPYVRDVVDSEEKYLRHHGLDVLHSEALEMEDSLAIAVRLPEENYRFALDVCCKAPEAEAVFISCGGMRTFDIIEDLEKATGKHVVSSNLCNAWMCLRLGGISEPILGRGSLLAKER